MKRLYDNLSPFITAVGSISIVLLFALSTEYLSLKQESQKYIEKLSERVTALELLVKSQQKKLLFEFRKQTNDKQ